ncbi:hypothetical protein NDU88_004283 [Pleurodeles waltl]|uniref:Uncharacterized protein n=1 Tax=Pleurodeles waltl TaxID=8319 RepID=A0AAV7RKW2_PLEWA|nr:hypothetical protein NDU88_004283 [Pleurodeles waltl]
MDSIMRCIVSIGTFLPAEFVPQHLFLSKGGEGPHLPARCLLASQGPKPAATGGPPTPSQALRSDDREWECPTLGSPHLIQLASRSPAYLHGGARAAGSPTAVARAISAQSTGVRVPVRSAGAPGVDLTTQDGRPCGQAPHRGTAGRHDHLASVSLDRKDPSASRVVSHTSRTSAQMHSGVRVARSSPRSSPPQSCFSPRGARAPKRRADAPGITHRAAASAEEPLTSGSAERHSPGRHLEFIDPVAACVYGTDLPLFVSGGIPGVQEPSGIFRAMPIV